MSQERIAFENWLGIQPCGAAHDLAWAAWQARAILALRPAAPDEFASLRSRIDELEAQLEAIGAGGVEPLK